MLGLARSALAVRGCCKAGALVAGSQLAACSGAADISLVRQVSGVPDAWHRQAPTLSCSYGSAPGFLATAANRAEASTLHACAGYRLMATDSRAAALQRLSRASRHRVQRSGPTAAKAGSAEPPVAGTETGSEVAVTPAETKASEVQLSQVVGHSALVITRPVEWGTVIFGYEQANKYQVFDQDGTLVALIAEDYSGLGNELGRQLLRTRRSFTATVFSADGTQVIFRVRRPAYLVTSTMLIEDGTGAVIGEVHRRWSLLKRNYDLYMDKQQFAAISGNFLAWEFELKDDKGGTLALIDRNFQGFGKEIFTDAGKYVIHFGMPAQEAAEVASRSAQLKPGSPPIAPMAMTRTDVPVIPTAAGNQLAVVRPLELSERMITLACAISVDYDFFSQHSHGGGLMGGFMPMPMPIPMPMPGGGGGTESDGGAAGGAAGAAGAAAGEAPAPGSGPDAGQMPGASGSGQEMDLGNDQWSQQSGQWGQNDQEIKWDDGGLGGGEEGAGSIVGTIWGWVSDGGE